MIKETKSGVVENDRAGSPACAQRWEGLPSLEVKVSRLRGERAQTLRRVHVVS